MAKYRVLILPVVLLCVGLGFVFGASRYWSPQPQTVALERCICVGLTRDQVRPRLEKVGYKLGVQNASGQDYLATASGTRFNVHVGYDPAGLVTGVSGIVHEVAVPGHPDLRYKEPRAEVLKSLGAPASDRTDNYASRWSVYDKLKLTLVFDENDLLQRAYVADPAYLGPEESSEAN